VYGSHIQMQPAILYVRCGSKTLLVIEEHVVYAHAGHHTLHVKSLDCLSMRLHAGQ